MREQSGADVVKTWKAGPTIECRGCGADLRYVDRMRASAVLWAAVVASFVAFFAAIALWGNVGAVAAAIVIVVALPFVMLSTEYKLADPGHDS